MIEALEGFEAKRRNYCVRDHATYAAICHLDCPVMQKNKIKLRRLKR
jgi:hypothetical protein